MGERDHDAALVRHIAERVYGWRILPRDIWLRHPISGLLVDCGNDGYYFAERDGSATVLFAPLADTTLGRGQAMEVWERARERCHEIHLTWRAWSQTEPWAAEVILLDDDDRHWGYGLTGPRAICEAIARATGWKGGKDAK